MKTFLAAAVSTLLAFPAIATTYSGTGAILSTDTPSVYTAGDTVTWSFTLGGPITTPLGPASEVTAFNLSVSGQSWTFADFIPLVPVMPFAAPLGGSLEVFFTGVNSNNAVLITGIRFFSSDPFPETSFFVTEPTVTFDPGGFTPSAFGALGGPPAPPAIPEPASWAMLIAGFGLTGAIARRRRMVVVA